MLNESTEPPRMFWGVVLKPEKRYEQTVEEPFHISKACIEPTTSKGCITSVFIEVDDEEFLICNLSEKILNESLDLNFNAGDKIVFKTTGNGTVHLSGYNILEEDGDEPEDMYETFSEDDGTEESASEVEDVPTLVNGKRKRSGTLEELIPAKKSNKELSPLDKLLAEQKKKPGTAKEEKKQAEDLRKKLNAKKAESEDIEESDDEDSDDGEGEEESDANDFINDEAEEGSDDDDDDDEDEEDGDESMETDETPKKSPKKQVNGSPAAKEIATKKDKKKDKQKPPQTPNASKSDAEAKSPGAAGETQSEKKKKKKKKKNKNKENEVNATNTPGKEQNKSGQDKTPGKPGSQEKKSEKQQTPGKTPKKTLKGGLMVEDLKIGNGPEAKKGKHIGMFYEGKLKSNGKKFDGNFGGKPFKFRLGSGEVIKGWDAGIEGMKVGGKRRLTIPAHMAYGAQGAPPDIPPNATLLFDVECKAVN